MTPMPPGLTPAAQEVWRAIDEAYAVQDASGQLLLEAVVRSFDTMRAAAAELARDGLTIADKFGQRKPHPAAAVARDARAGLLAALKQLDLSHEAAPAPKKFGRPGGPMTVARRQELGLR